MSQDYHQTPSQVMNLTPQPEILDDGSLNILGDDYLEFQFNQAVSIFGRWFDSKLMERTKNGIQLWSAERLLNDNTEYGLSDWLTTINTSFKEVHGFVKTDIRRNPDKPLKEGSVLIAYPKDD